MRIKNIMYCSLIFIFTSGLAHAEGHDKTVTIVNNSSHTIISLQATNSRTEDWGDNLLLNVIKPGERESVNVDDGSNTCIYDLRANMRNDMYALDMKTNVCNLGFWYIHD